MELGFSRSVRRFFLYIALCGSGIVIGIVIALMWDSGRYPSFLTASLPASWSGASAEFDSRLRARFPLGMPVDEFIFELYMEGFKPTWFESAGYYGAVRSEGWVLCKVNARVRWQLGPGDTLAYIDGNYREEGCL